MVPWRISDLLGGVSLRDDDEEDAGVLFSAEAISAMSDEQYRLSLVGKIVVGIICNPKLLYGIMLKQWQGNGMEVEVLSKDVVSFRFPSEAALNRIRSKGLLTFSGYLLILLPFVPCMQPAAIPFRYIEIDVRAYNVPGNARNGSIRSLLANTLGIKVNEASIPPPKA